MTFSSEFKLWLRTRYPDCWTTYERYRNTPAIVQFATVAILDYTYKQKSTRVGIKTGHQYFCYWTEDIDELFRCGITRIYACLDRGAPINKSLVHHTRYAKGDPLPVPENDWDVVVDDETIPSYDDWSRFMANKALVPDLIYYLTCKLLDIPLRFPPPPNAATTAASTRASSPPINSDHSAVDLNDLRISTERHDRYSVNPGCVLLLHGGRFEPPCRQFPVRTIPSKQLVYLACERRDIDHDGRRVQRDFLVTGVEDNLPQSTVDNLLEGELAAAFYLKRHLREPVLVSSVDGDLIPILLLGSADRRDRHSGNWLNTVFLQLTSSGRRETAILNINQLYDSLYHDPMFCHCRNPVLTACLAMILSDNDYVLKFCPGIGCIRPGSARFKSYKTLVQKNVELMGSSLACPRISTTTTAAGAAPAPKHTMFRVTSGNTQKTTGFPRTSSAPEPVKRPPSPRATSRRPGQLKLCDRGELRDHSPEAHVQRLRDLDELTELSAGVPLPAVLATLLLHSSAFSLIVEKTLRDPLSTQHNPLDNMYDIKLNEELFIEFVQQLYTDYYKLMNKSYQTIGLNPSPITVRDYLRKTRKRAGDRMLVPRLARRIARQALWTLQYWVNGSRGACYFADPTTTYRGLAYYGWRLLEGGQCCPAQRVSKAPPTLTFNRSFNVRAAPYYTDGNTQNTE